MSSVIISGDTSGSITLAAPAVAGTNTITLPAATGTAMVSGNMPAFSAYKSTDQTGISNNTWTKITFDTETFDTNSNFASSRFTPTVAGYYQIQGQTAFVGTVMTNQGIGIYKNGSEYNSVYLRSSASDLAVQVVNLVYMNGTTDYVEIYGRIVGSSGLYFAGGSGNSFFSGSMVRSA